MAITGAPKCQHQQDDGARCQRPALSRLRLCAFHHHQHKRNAKKLAERERQRWFDSVDTTEGAAVQRAIAEIIRRLVLGLINHDKAGQMLFGLRVATEKPQCFTREDRANSC